MSERQHPQGVTKIQQCCELLDMTKKLETVRVLSFSVDVADSNTEQRSI